MNDFQVSCREIVEQALCSLLADAGVKSLSRDFVRKVAILFGVFEDDSSIDEIIYGAKEKFERRQYLRRNPPESAAYVRELWRKDVEALKKKYDTFMFWVVFIGMIVGSAWLALLSR